MAAGAVHTSCDDIVSFGGHLVGHCADGVLDPALLILERSLRLVKSHPRRAAQRLWIWVAYSQCFDPSFDILAAALEVLECVLQRLDLAEGDGGRHVLGV